MASFYNTTRGPISYTLKGGAVGTIAGKTWRVIDDNEAVSASLLRLVQQGFLVRKNVAPPSPVPAKTVQVKPPVLVQQEKVVVVEQEKPVVEEKRTAPPVRRRAKRAARLALKTESTPSLSSVEVPVVAETEKTGESTSVESKA